MPSSSPDTRTAIIIAAYNAEATIESAATSALTQPEAVEICIVDDASTDRTAAIGHSLAARDRRILFHSLAANSGPSVARNIAIAMTSAPWLTILDADDYLLPGRLGRLHALAAEADFVGDALIRTSTDVAPSGAPKPLSGVPLDFVAFIEGNSSNRRKGLHLGFLKPLMRRSFLVEKQLHYSPDLRLGEDYELYARALLLGAHFLVCGEAGYVSVEREGSLSKYHGAAELARLRDCDDRIAATRPLAPAERAALDRHRTSVDCRLQWQRLIDAVKARDVGTAWSTFRSPPVISYLVGKLAEQAWLRSTGRGPNRRAKPPTGAV